MDLATVTSRAVLGVIAGTLVIAGAVTAGASVREHVLAGRCEATGGAPLWQADPATDHRPNGLLPFECREATR